MAKKAKALGRGDGGVGGRGRGGSGRGQGRARLRADEQLEDCATLVDGQRLAAYPYDHLRPWQGLEGPVKASH